MKTARASEVKKNFDKYLNAVQSEPIIVLNKDGVGVAVLLSWKEYQKLETWEATASFRRDHKSWVARLFEG
jgi:prevent-host-death family protein